MFDGQWSAARSPDEVGIYMRPLMEYALEVCESYTMLGMSLLDADSTYSGHYANEGET